MATEISHSLTLSLSLYISLCLSVSLCLSLSFCLSLSLSFFLSLSLSIYLCMYVFFEETRTKRMINKSFLVFVVAWSDRFNVDFERQEGTDQEK